MVSRFYSVDAQTNETNVACWPDINNCLDWTPWRKALGVTSRGGGYAVEYVFYILYSVLTLVARHCGEMLTQVTDVLRRLRMCPSQDIRHIC